MHATYLFLIDGVTKDSTEPEITGLFDDNYASRFCDDNNWYSLLYCILPDSTLIPLCPEGDWRGRDRYQDSLKDKQDLYANRLRFAFELVAVDAGIEGASYFSLASNKGNDRLAKMTAEELKEALLTEAPQRLAEMYKAPVKERSEWYDRRGLSVVVEQFTCSTLGEGAVPPFSPYLTSPYNDYRCFDLRSSNDSPGAILAVDIHT